MKKLISFVLIVLLSCQLGLSAVGGAMNDSIDQIHQVFSHDRALEHHHHQDHSVHFEIDTSELSHQHLQDNFDPSNLTDRFQLLDAVLVERTIRYANSQMHPDIFLDGLLRPPRALTSVVV
ncbi:hypothetical protein [Zwartia vadi]|uniref:hypothetical protein n=1 Tax=Zwartia vadi TaxID=3058168 RepID=UPI0025B42442|nr:hypothetical protein [Zwartia vadi]MDN3988874.1 hypothetical protein [Zwartia vadi]